MTDTREAKRIAQTIDYKAIDVDNHYYEPLDALTRHLPKEFKRRGVQMLSDGKRTFAVIGDRVNHFIPNPTFDPIIVAGCMDLMFRGQIPEGVDPRTLMKLEPLRAEYQDRDARLAVMDEQGLEAIVMFRRSRWASSRCSVTTSKRPWRCSTRSTSGSTRTGASRTRTASSPCR
jgi:hypothetical protein